MKTLALIISAVTFWTLNIYGQSDNVNELLEKQGTRTEIFNSILNNHVLMTEFIHAMKNNDHAMMMIRSDSAMMVKSSMSGMHSSGEHQMMGMNNNSEMMNQMMNMMKEHPEMVHQMMGNMMDMCEQNSTQCDQMTEVMSEHPHMMMMGMQKMKEKESGDQNTSMEMMHNSGELKDSEYHHMHK